MGILLIVISPPKKKENFQDGGSMILARFWGLVYSIMLILRHSGIFFLGERNLHDQVVDPSCNAKEEPNVIVFQVWFFFFVFLQHVIDSSWISISPTNINVNPEMCRG